MFGKLQHADDKKLSTQLITVTRNSPFTLELQELQIYINSQLSTVRSTMKDIYLTKQGWSGQLDHTLHSVTETARDCPRHKCSPTPRINMIWNGIELSESQWLRVWFKRNSNLVSISVLFWHNWSSFLSCHLLIEISRRINASPLESDTGRGGHYRAFLD